MHDKYEPGEMIPPTRFNKFKLWIMEPTRTIARFTVPYLFTLALFLLAVFGALSLHQYMKATIANSAYAQGKADVAQTIRDGVDQGENKSYKLNYGDKIITCR